MMAIWTREKHEIVWEFITFKYILCPLLLSLLRVAVFWNVISLRQWNVITIAVQRCNYNFDYNFNISIECMLLCRSYFHVNSFIDVTVFKSIPIPLFFCFKNVNWSFYPTHLDLHKQTGITSYNNLFEETF